MGNLSTEFRNDHCIRQKNSDPSRRQIDADFVLCAAIVRLQIPLSLPPNYGYKFGAVLLLGSVLLAARNNGMGAAILQHAC
eukprot:3923759-Pleurochrysis_carterae.AAC.2